MRYIFISLLVLLQAGCKTDTRLATPVVPVQKEVTVVPLPVEKPTPVPQQPAEKEIQPSPVNNTPVVPKEEAKKVNEVKRVCLDNGKCKYLHIHKKYQGHEIPK